MRFGGEERSDGEVEGAGGLDEGEVCLLAKAQVVVLTEVDDAREEFGGEEGNGRGGRRGGKEEVGGGGDFDDKEDGEGVREGSADGG